MAQLSINVGSTDYAGDGESLRNALIKVNTNFTEVYADINTVALTVDAIGNALSNINVPTDISQLSDSTNLLFDGDYVNLTNKPTIPADISELTDTTNLLSSGYTDNVGVWGGTAPTTVNDAIDRLATAIYQLNGNNPIG